MVERVIQAPKPRLGLSCPKQQPGLEEVAASRLTRDRERCIEVVQGNLKFADKKVPLTQQIPANYPLLWKPCPARR